MNEQGKNSFMGEGYGFNSGFSLDGVDYEEQIMFIEEELPQSERFWKKGKKGLKTPKEAKNVAQKTESKAETTFSLTVEKIGVKILKNKPEKERKDTSQDWQIY
jgi:hypothetical protein